MHSRMRREGQKVGLMGCTLIKHLLTAQPTQGCKRGREEQEGGLEAEHSLSVLLQYWPHQDGRFGGLYPQRCCPSTAALTVGKGVGSGLEGL